MFSRQLNKITRQTSSLLFNDTKKNAVMDFHKNRMYISNKKCKSKEVHKDNVTWGKAINKKCQSKWDKEAKKNKKAKFWSKLFGSSSTTQDDLPICMPVKCKDDPDLSMFGGQPYGTCGDAYIIKIENVGEIEEVEYDKETELIRKIEAPYHLKNIVNDPTPTFHSAEQRLLEMNDQRLHPLYNKLRNLQKKPKQMPKLQDPEYKFFSGPMKKEEIPVQIKFNTDLLESKHMYSAYKKVEPPTQIVGPLIEIKMNEKRKYDEKPNVFFCDERPNPDRKVYDSVFQHPNL